MKGLIDTLEQLSTAFGVSGFEDEVRARIAERLSGLGVQLQTDVLGNLLVTLNPGTDFTVMVDAHMDEVGIMVSHVEEGGSLRFATLGGWDPRVLPGHQVEICAKQGERIWGVIGAAPPHVQSPEEQKTAYKTEELFIDVGTHSAEETERLGIRVGVPATVSLPFRRLAHGLLTGKALDNRIGCSLLTALLEHFHEKPPDYTLVASFTVNEEVGLRGATAASHQIRPDLALVVEATTADTPGAPPAKQPSFLGKGPVITLADRNIIVRPVLVEQLIGTAQDTAIPHQVKRPVTGGTNAGAIHLSRGGALTGVVSVPCRYLHSPVSVAYDQDVFHAYFLLRACLEKARRIHAACTS